MHAGDKEPYMALGCTAEVMQLTADIRLIQVTEFIPVQFRIRAVAGALRNGIIGTQIIFIEYLKHQFTTVTAK
jgi:hypothetical protein